MINRQSKAQPFTPQGSAFATDYTDKMAHTQHSSTVSPTRRQLLSVFLAAALGSMALPLLADEAVKPVKLLSIGVSTSRLRPVVLAAATTILGMIPLLGDAFFVSMAVTIMAGLAFASVLTLIATPVFYYLFFKRDEKQQEPAAPAYEPVERQDRSYYLADA